MRLYYKQHASSLAVNITLKWLKLSHEMIRTEFFDTVLYKHNPTGTVGFVELDNGQILTQVSAIMKRLAREHSSSGIAGDGDKETDYQIDRWLSYLTSDVHHYFHLLFLPQRYAIENNEEAREAALKQCYKNFEILDAHLRDRTFMLGDNVSIVDALLFPMIRWSYMVFPEDKRNYANLNNVHDAMLMDPAVKDAMEAEDIWNTVSR